MTAHVYAVGMLVFACLIGWYATREPRDLEKTSRSIAKKLLAKARAG